MCLGKIRRLMGFLATSYLALAWCADALTLTEVIHSDGAAWHTVPLVSRERKTWQHDAAAPTRVCALDVFHFGVTFAAPSARYGSSEEQDKGFVWELVAQEVDGWNAGAVVAFGPFEVATFPVEEDNVNELLTPHRQDDGSSEMEGMETEKETLECEFDPEFCVLKLVGIRLPDIEDVEGGGSLQIGHSLELEFNQPTNRPNASTKDQIDRVISFTEYIGSDLVGSWSADGQVLSIRINELDQNQVKPVQEFMQGLLQTSIHVAEARGRHEARKVIAFDGQQSLRIAPPGTYLVRVSAIDGESIWSPLFAVQNCDDSHFVLYPTSSEDTMSDAASSTGAREMTAPSFALDGVLTHGGHEGFSLPHDSMLMESAGSWSLSFWVFLTQDSTGSFRSLFFHGDGNGEQRTPSAWWKPDERRLVLRVSTNVNTDVGLDSSEELPLNCWMHMGFTFINCSRSVDTADTKMLDVCQDQMASEDGWLYSLSFYVNGLLDTEVRIRDLVLANEGPLHIGKGPWTDGMQGFTSNLRVFPAPISAAEHRERYFLEKRAHENHVNPGRERGEIDNDIEASWTHSAVRHPATQISFLLQRFQTEWTSPHEGGGDGPSEDSPEPGNFKKVQNAAYQCAIAAVESCTTDAWDLLVEAADLGHPAALSDTGEAYLYGTYPLPDHCASLSHDFSVEQNLTHAKELLERAFKGGVLDAGKPLALLLGMHPEHGNLSQFTTGLFHLSAASGRKEAFAILGSNYRPESSTSQPSTEVAVYHYYHAAVEASVAFHERGKQPLHEMTRLYDSLERDVTIGERGDDDELIQFQKMRADKEGNVAAMAAMGGLYYWGAHGVTRDHAQAYHYFERAAQAGDTGSQSAVAGMLLKGEGAAQDNATAIGWYEKAAEKNHTRALNGLGFIYFHGSGGVSENKSLALEYFERAAANEEDGDSVFNAGYCHATGLGTAVNVTRAMQFYDVAVKMFGHFDAIFEMGKIYMEGVSGIIPRDSGRALPYLKAAAEGGQWGSTMRKAFDLYVNGEFERAVVLYHEARAFAYPVATSNLAFLYDQKLLRSGDEASERQGLKYLYLASEENGDKEVLVRIGDYHYYGLAGLRKDPIVALRWYSRASAEGVDVGAYNVGHMYEFGDGVKANLARAERYYNRVLELSSDSTEIYLVVRFALARLSLRKWLHHTPFEALLGFQSPMTATADTNKSRIDSVLAFDATKTFSGKYYPILTSTLAILAVGIAVRYFQRTR